MRKYFLLGLLCLFAAGTACAETTASDSSSVDTAPSPAVSEPSPSPAEESPATTPPSPAVENAPSPVAAVTPSVESGATAAEGAVSENLEFVSGEIGSVDEAAKTVTVKLYGETENTAGDKTLSVKVDETTDITDGEKDRDLKSLTAGTEVDVEYDPATNKATYIFVY